MNHFIAPFLLLFSIAIQAQEITVTRMADMPEPTSNNAVVEGWANDTGYVYSFGGIDSSKIWSGIHLNSFRYNTVTDVWDTIPPLPDTMGKIAAGASYVDSIIYIIGGYHVLANSTEISSNKVHRFDPRTNTYLSDGAPIPTPIDDHVQAVYQDSLIFVITGWSNTGNVPDVQIYDPANDNWLTGTPVPNTNAFKAFGASGTISDNTIYYHGGASTALNFPGQTAQRVGIINTANPTLITWAPITNTSYVSYRAACFESAVSIYTFMHWVGGSEITYNYNGIAYNGSGGVSPTNRNYVNGYGQSFVMGDTLPMDLRGIAGPFSSVFQQNAGNDFYLAGGMEKNQKVSNKTLHLQVSTALAIQEQAVPKFTVYPNPTTSILKFQFGSNQAQTIRISDVAGKVMTRVENDRTSLSIDVSNYSSGIYFVEVTTAGERSSQKIIIP